MAYAAKDLIAACHGHEILRYAQDDIGDEIMSDSALSKTALAQPRAGVEPEEGAAADRIPLRSERRRLADHLQVAPKRAVV
jgi:hypothetical protein